jgi:uncharacterized membrane protein
MVRAHATHATDNKERHGLTGAGAVAGGAVAGVTSGALAGVVLGGAGGAVVGGLVGGVLGGAFGGGLEAFIERGAADATPEDAVQPRAERAAE